MKKYIEKFIKDYLKFLMDDVFQWYILIMVFMLILRSVGYISPTSFEKIFQNITLGLWVTKGAKEFGRR